MLQNTHAWTPESALLIYAKVVYASTAIGNTSSIDVNAPISRLMQINEFYSHLGFGALMTAVTVVEEKAFTDTDEAWRYFCGVCRRSLKRRELRWAIQ